MCDLSPRWSFYWFEFIILYDYYFDSAWIGNCVGHYNYKFFVTFLFWTSVTTGFSLYLIGSRLYVLFSSSSKSQAQSHPHDDQLAAAATMGVLDTIALWVFTMLGSLVCIMVTCLLSFHIRMITKNVTTIESFELHHQQYQLQRWQRQQQYHTQYGQPHIVPANSHLQSQSFLPVDGPALGASQGTSPKQQSPPTVGAVGVTSVAASGAGTPLPAMMTSSSVSSSSAPLAAAYNLSTVTPVASASSSSSSSLSSSSSVSTAGAAHHQGASYNHNNNKPHQQHSHTYHRYDVGVWRNVTDVLGNNPLTWLVPIGRVKGDGHQFTTRAELNLPAGH